MSNGPRLSEVYIADLALLTTHELIAKYNGTGTAHQSARKRRGIKPVPIIQLGPACKTEPWHHRLGLETDAAIAATIGRGKSAVTMARIKRGIAAFAADAEKPIWTPLLGVVPDREIAARHGVSSTQVKNARNRAGLPPAAVARVAKVSAPRPAPAPRPPAPVVVAAVKVAPVKAAPAEPYRPVDKVKLPRVRDIEPAPGVVRPEVLEVGPAVGCVCVGSKTCWFCR